MKKLPIVTVPFVADQFTELRELRGKQARITSLSAGYDAMLAKLSDLADEMERPNMPAEKKARLLELLVSIAALAQRTAEDCRCCRREWVGGEEDA